MNRVEELELEIASLSPQERAVLVRSLGAGFCEGDDGVESTPGVCGGAACLVRTRIPVWVLEQMRRQGIAESEILRSYPALQARDLVHAWDYAAGHPDEMDREISENEDA